MTPNSEQTKGDSNKKENQQLPKVYIRLPYIGNRATDLIRNFRIKKLRLLNTHCNIIIYWNTMTTSCFVSWTDKTPKEFQSSIVYKFSCPGCSKSYIGKTDKCLYTRLNEHATIDKSIVRYTNKLTIANTSPASPNYWNWTLTNLTPKNSLT